MLNPKETMLLFDLGGVLIEMGDLGELLGLTGIDYGRFHDEFKLSRAVRDFERGIINPSIFATRFISEFGLTMEYHNEFLETYRGWLIGKYEEIDSLLTRLKDKGFTLACLSNTNPLHAPRLMEDLGLHFLLTHRFLSFETGLRKPDPEAFLHVAESTGFSPKNIILFDDEPINISVAIEYGFGIYQVTTQKKFKAKLQELL